MSYDLYRGSDDDQSGKLAFYMQLWGSIRPRRSAFEGQWEESAALYWPEYRNTFTYGSGNFPGQKKAQFQIDSSVAVASHRFMAIAETFLMPTSLVWSKFAADDDDLMKDRSIAQYFHDFTKVVWKHRYRPEANFVGQNQQNLQGLGVFGNMGMWIDEYDTELGQATAGNRYSSTPVGEVYVLQNYQGQVDGCIRHFRWNARQIMQRWGEKTPDVIRTAFEQSSQQLWDILHFVMPRTDCAPWMTLHRRGKPWSSCYIALAGTCIMEEGGYRSLPLAYGRYSQAPEEDYGRGPGQMVLAEAKTLNAEKGDYLKQGHRAADPALLIGDDGLMDFKNTPGAFNYGGWNEDGKILVGAVPHGDIQVTKEMMDESRAVVNDAFLVGYFKYLFEDGTRQKSAREIVERANGIGMFLAPMLGRQNSEYIPAMIAREVDSLAWQRLLPDKPDALREAEGEYKIIFTSPLMRALSGQAVAGYYRTAEFARDMQNITGDPTWTDRFDPDTALPEIAESEFVPPNWMANDAKVAAKRKSRAEAQQEDNRIKALPGESAIIKAEAVKAKAMTGGNTGGVLSGMPVGGMPTMPGQDGPGGRAFGQPGQQ